MVERNFTYNGVNFFHKTNPISDTVAPKSKVWCQRAEGSKLSRKGSNEGNGGKTVQLCEEYPRDK